jgi:hypothetical protein
MPLMLLKPFHVPAIKAGKILSFAVFSFLELKHPLYYYIPDTENQVCRAGAMPFTLEKGAKS